MRKIIENLNAFVKFTSLRNPWTNVYGLARSCLAFGTFLTFVFNETHLLFRPAAGVDSFPVCNGMAKYGIFCLLSSHLDLTRFIVIFILFLVVIGWQPRLTGVFHWWISFSFVSSAIVVDGGDQVASVLALLLIPFCLTDNRKWHWNPSEISQRHDIWKFIVIALWVAVFFTRLQVSLIYFQAGTAKLNVDEWKDGTAIYYWALNPMIGLPEWIKPFATPLLSNSLIVVLLSWGTIAFEILLFTALVIEKKWRKKLLVYGIVFHLLIVLVFGLVSFFFAMTAALIMFLRPLDEPFNIKQFYASYDNFLIKFRKNIFPNFNPHSHGNPKI